MQLSSIKEVEYLQHDKCVEDNWKMPWIVVCRIESSLIVNVSVYSKKSSTTDVTSDNSVSPLILRMRQVRFNRIVQVNIFWKECLTLEDNDQQDRYLVDRLTNNMFKHCFWNDVVITSMRFTFEQIRIWLFCSQSKRSKCIHNEIDP